MAPGGESEIVLSHYLLILGPGLVLGLPYTGCFKHTHTHTHTHTHIYIYIYIYIYTCVCWSQKIIAMTYDDESG